MTNNTNSTNSGNGQNRRGKYTQPVSIEAIDYLLKDDNGVDVEYYYLNDKWDRTEYSDRDEVIDELVQALCWITDTNKKLIYETLEDTKLYNNWHSGKDTLHEYIEHHDNDLEDNQHYSVYTDDDENSSSQATAIDSTTEQNVTNQLDRKEKRKTKHDKKCENTNKLLKNIH